MLTEQMDDDIEEIQEDETDIIELMKIKEFLMANKSRARNQASCKWQTKIH